MCVCVCLCVCVCVVILEGSGGEITIRGAAGTAVAGRGEGLAQLLGHFRGGLAGV